MLWQWSPSVIAELAASAIMLILAIYFPWRDLNRQARLTGVTLVVFCALWILSHAIEIGLPVVSYKEALVGLQLVLGIIALTFWLFYIFHYLGPSKLLTRRTYILFGIIPLIAILALSTNDAYGLMWTEIGLDSQNPYLPLQPTYGTVYWACMVYIAMLTLTGSFLIIWNIIRRRYSYRRESIYLLIAAVIPLVTAFIEVMGLLSFLRLSVGLSPWAACIGAVILILNLPRFHLEQVLPIARNIIFERIGDCILVLDKQNRVLDLNPAAEQLTGHRISDAFGLSIERVWPYKATPILPFDKMDKAGEELVLERDGKQRAYDQRISTIIDASGRLTGRVVLLTDITEYKLAKEQANVALEKYRVLFEAFPLGISVTDAAGNIIETNKESERLLGLTHDAHLQRKYDAPEWQIVRPDGTPMPVDEYASVRAMKENRRIENVEMGIVKGRDEITWINVTAEPIPLENYGVAITYGDISERRKSEEKLQKSYASLKKTLSDAINTMVKIVEVRDPYTAGHQQRVAHLATAIARKMRLEDIRIDQLRTAAVIHDIGKMYVPSDILSKPGKISDGEFNLIKTHPQSGFDIIKDMDFPCNIAKTVLQHHERLDGSGYPNQLKGEDTLLEARILAVADVIEAMASHRPYRPALGVDKALEEISKNKGKIYDPDVVDACLELFKRGEFEFKPV